MASSLYSSTPETTNANRACRVVLGPCTDGLRDVLRQEVPPHTFPNVIKQNKLNLPRLTAVQRDLILPNHGGYKGIYNDMDISLLYILLRNITNISPHSKGWGNDPDPHDTSLSANIERIRLVRNRCVHSCDPFMSNTDFNSIWSTIRSTMVDLDVFLVNGNKYEKAVDFLRHESMDPENDLHYEEELRKQVEEDKTTREMVDNLENKLEKLTKSPIPQNVREQYDIDIEKWREEDKLYYETHSFPSVMEKVRNQPCVTFVGVPGSGKSATAHHIALNLQEEGYEVVPVDEIREIKQYCDTKNPQVFVIDDVVGTFGLQKTKLDVLTDYEQKITKPCMVKSRTLITCRESVFNETLPYKPFLTKEETVIKLHSFDHALDDNDKKQILKKHGLNVNLISPALLTSASRMFPLLCKLFSKEPKFQALGSEFFINPIQCIIDELDDMQRQNKLNYVTLVLCMLNGNCLSKVVLNDRQNQYFMNMKTDTLEKCELESQTDAFKFVNALSAMEGTYTKQCGAKYTLIHDSMFEICAYQYGKQFPDQMLLYMSSSYIANYVKPQTNETGIAKKEKEKQRNSQSIERDKSSIDSDIKGQKSDDENSEREESFDLCIRLREDQYPLLAERLYRDIQNMELYDVFRNRVLKHAQVCQAFLGVLETKSYTELKSVFLSSQGNIDKILSKQEYVVDESEERRDFGEWKRQGVLVDERNKQDEKGGTYEEYNVRVISWVIYYGHHQILEYIVQKTEQHKEVSELFGITGNSPQESRSEIFENDKNIDFNRSRRERMVESSGIDACNNPENNRSVEQSISGIYTCSKQESETNRFVEECRLLALCCYSGDVQTVRVLLPVCKKAITGIGQISEDIQWYSPLNAACQIGHVNTVEELVKEGADVNLQNIWGTTPLIAACWEGHVGVVEKLVKVGADVNLQDKHSQTPLIVACGRGHVNLVEELVKAGADVNVQAIYGDTPLTAACRGGHVSIVEELLKAGADVNLKAVWGNTPLIDACKEGHVSVVEEMVKAGADVNLQDNHKCTPLIVACEGGYASMVEELVKAGADVNQNNKSEHGTPLTAACSRGHVSIVKELVKAGADVNLQNTGIFGTWDTPLITACERGYESIVEELVKAGADVNVQAIYGDTPLTAACRGGHVSIVEELLKAGADVNLKAVWGNTPLIDACKEGHVSVVEEMVKAGADVNLQDNHKCTPLIVACEGGYASMVEELVKAGADVNQNNKSEHGTPLTAACSRGHVSIVKELVKAGADVNLQNTGIFGTCDTPLITACERGYESIMEELVKAGADVNQNNKSEHGTPLIAACSRGHVSIVKELVKAGADVNLQNTGIFGTCDTPLITACERGYESIVKELVKAGADVNLQVTGILCTCDTPLIAACKREHVSIVKELVKAGADVNLQNMFGNTPLIDVCEKIILKVGADVNLQATGVFETCTREQVSIVEELVKAGADVNIQNKQGNTPLLAACRGGYVSIVKELVKAGAHVNLQYGGNKTPLIAACFRGNVSIVEELYKAGADVNLQDIWGTTPLIVACGRGHLSVVEEMVKVGADVNIQNMWGNTPLLAAVRKGSLSTVKYLVEHEADWVTQVVNINVSAVYKALILNKPDIVKYLLKEQNEITPGKFNGNVHLFNCLVDIRHAGVKTDSRDDVVVTDRSVWCMDEYGDLWEIIIEGDCDVLRHLLYVGLDVNQSIKLYDKFREKSDVRPLLYTLIDVNYHNTGEKMIMLLWAGADVNVRMSKCDYVLHSLRCREYDRVLDREGVSALERTRRLVCKYGEYSRTDYKRVLCEIKKHVRRHSV